MQRWISVDSGKFRTKVAEYNTVRKNARSCHFRTKIGPGDFRDDSLEKNTIIVEIDGATYKIGNGALGKEAELETTKQTDIHKIATLAAIAVMCSQNETDEVSVAIGLPAMNWADVGERENYKQYMLEDKEYCIKIKKSSDSPIVEKKFKIKNKYAFPESIGALFADDAPEITEDTMVGVLDIGNLNINATVWQNVELQKEDSFTGEQGGKLLIQSLSQELYQKLGIRCNEKVVGAAIYGKEPGDRYLIPSGTMSEEQRQHIKETSNQIINESMYNFVREIKAMLDAQKWAIEFMPIIVIGGTGKVLEHELKKVFGDIYVIKNACDVNAMGFLNMMCAKKAELGIDIFAEDEAEEIEAASGTNELPTT